MAEPFHCDFQRQLFMGHLGNHLLNAADFHSNDRGFGMNYLNTINKTWVLSRLAVEMEEMPKAYDRFFVYTWVENAMRYFTNRNFKVEEQSTGKVYGYGRSVWAMIDTETRQPVNLMEIHDGDIVNYVTRELDCPIDKSSRVRMTDDAELVATAMAAYDDIDMNGHVNSIKYIEHVLDLFKLDWYKTHSLRRFEIAYVAEAHEGEMVCNRRIASELIEIFTALYKARYPIEKIRLIDDYGANDEASMTDNNTSSFCYRTVSGTKRISKHGYGIAVDVNTLYNPYVVPRKDGTVHIEPAAAKPYVDRSAPNPYKIDRNDLAYKLFTERGFIWGGDWTNRKDYQHFEKPAAILMKK